MKVLASDFDGTVFFDGGFRQDDLNRIKEFQAGGHLFGMCTGRPLQGVMYFSKGYLDCDFYIVSSGALITDRNGKILYEKCISFDVMKDIYNHYSDDLWVCVQADGVIYKKESGGALKEIQKEFDDIDELKDAHIYGLSINAKDEACAKKICKEINHCFEEVTAFQNKEFIDVVKRGCSKGEGIEQLKKILEVESIGGIGDSFNDLPLLQTADVSFTFHSSPDIVKREADYLVDSLYQAIDLL